MATVAVAPTAEAVHAPGRAVLAILTVVGVAAGASSLAFALTNDSIGAELGEPLVIASVFTWTTVAYILCGLLAWWRRPLSRFGPLMVWTGFVLYLDTLAWTTTDVSYSVGEAVDKLPPVLLIYAFLAFPSGRLSRRLDRTLVAGAFAVAIVLQLVRMVVGDFGPNNLLGYAPHADVHEAVRKVQLVTLSVCCLAGVAILASRRWGSARPLRRSFGFLIDAAALGLVMIAGLYTSLAFNASWVRELRWATLITLSFAPIAFLVAILQARLARSAVGQLFVELRHDPAPADLRAALARALRDPSLTLAYWLPEFGTYADLDGHAVDLPQEHDRRATTLIERDGTRVAALIHDPALAEEPELLRAVTAAAGIALENARLHVDLRARLEEVAGSRARVIEAGQKERQRLERNLHDGAQQRLIALSLELKRLEKELQDRPDARKRLDEAQREITVSLDELRAVARGLHPAVLSAHGLEIALEQVAARAPVPVRLKVEIGTRLAEPVEVAAYYVVTESLANIGKHARATIADVDVVRAGSQLVVEVVDDGVGGADTERGTGLRGLADRVEALGGRLRVWTPLGGGTRVRAEIPCA